MELVKALFRSVRQLHPPQMTQNLANNQFQNQIQNVSIKPQQSTGATRYRKMNVVLTLKLKFDWRRLLCHFAMFKLK